MNRFLCTILIWLLLLFTIQFVFISWMHQPYDSRPLLHPGNGSSKPIDVFIFDDGDRISVRDHLVVNESNQQPIGKYRFIIREQYFPVAYHYELISKQELDIILNYAVSMPKKQGRPHFSGDQLYELNIALHNYAQNHPILSQVKPGGPPNYKIAWNRIWISFILFLIYGFASGLSMFGFKYIRKNLSKAKKDRREKLGLCINCSYPIGGLECDDCPECGLTHSSRPELSA